MRKDMDKVIIERPRFGHGLPSRKTGLRLRNNQILEDLDFGPIRQASSSSRQYGYYSKELSDLLSPLKRFLHTQVGRPWDKVESEIRTGIDARTLTGRHLLAHVYGFVHVKTVELDGRICIACSPSAQGRLNEVSGFYVHPRTGLLCFKKRPRAGNVLLL